VARKKRFSRARKVGGILSGKTSQQVMSGLGSAFVGNKISPAIGINPLIVSAGLGYFTGGAIGLVSAIAAETLTGHGMSLAGRLGTQQQSTPAGTVYN